MLTIIIITGGFLILKVFYDSAYYKGFHDGLKAMRDRCEQYLNEKNKEDLE